MITYVGVKVLLRAFLTSALGGVSLDKIRNKVAGSNCLVLKKTHMVSV
jgi:hypothetical protein